MSVVTAAQIKALAELAGVSVPDERLDALVYRVQGMLDGVKAIEALPLADEEPANTFSLEDYV